MRKKVNKTITVKSNEVFDGKGCLYTWRGAGYPSKCHASKEISEKEPPMFILSPGATLKNLQIECALDGIHTTKNNKIQNIINRDVEEDAITIGENILIEDSEFWFCQDKCLQMNRANKVTIRNNKFYHSSFPILANTGKSVSVSGNYFYNVNRAIRSNGSLSNISVRDNDVQWGDCYLAASNKAKIDDYGGGSVEGIKNKYCTESGGKITQK
ncbi:MAG: pectate lyase [Bdellovibrionota bacterium]